MKTFATSGTARRLAAVLIFAFAGTGAASALECPQLSQELALSGGQATPEQIQFYKDGLRGPDPANAVGFYIHALKASHPDISDAQIVNYLAAMYCAVLAESKCTDAVAQQKLVEFNKLVAAQVFGK